MRILVINNFDSFVNNICQYLREEGDALFAGDFWLDMVDVDALDLASLAGYDGVVVSPGPGVPSDYPNLFRAFDILSADARIPVLGVCLGLQAMWEYFGGSLYQLNAPKHGYAGALNLCGFDDPILGGFVDGDVIGRYHSWAVDGNKHCAMRITSYDSSCMGVEGAVPMSARHLSLPFYGLQFHPESCITHGGRGYIRNFLNLCR